MNFIEVIQEDTKGREEWFKYVVDKIFPLQGPCWQGYNKGKWLPKTLYKVEPKKLRVW